MRNDSINKQPTIIAEEADKTELNSDIDEGDFEEGALNHNYDIINLKDESYPFRKQVIDRLNWYYDKHKINFNRKAEAALASSNLFAVDI